MDETIAVSAQFGIGALLGFLSASGTSGAVLSVLNLLGSNLYNPRVSDLMVFSNIIGGLVLGAGMYLGQACPGTMFAQMGRFDKRGLIALLGGFTGAFTYSKLHSPLFERLNKVGNYGKVTLHGVLGADYWKVGLCFAAVMFGATYIVNRFLKKSSRPKKVKKMESGEKVKGKNWGPVVPGVGIGLLQLLNLRAVGSMLGASTQYVTLLAKTSPNIVGATSYGKGILSKSNALTKVALHPGILTGACISSSLAGRRKSLEKVVKHRLPLSAIAKSFVGGFLLVFGARIAGGCNSGHGLSGLGSQALSSYVATASMFAGGMGLAGLVALWRKYSKKDKKKKNVVVN